MHGGDFLQQISLEGVDFPPSILPWSKMLTGMRYPQKQWTTSG
jgi:hypothetical protein